MIPGNRTLTLLRAPLVNRGSQAAVRDWANADEIPLTGCNGPQPLSTDEFISDREYASTHLRVFAPFGADVRSTDRIRDGATVYDVDGLVQPWRDLGGSGHHVQFDIVLREG